MTVTVVVGAQWGDEAKGKIVDLLCEDAEIVARFNGGDNAGHTVINPFGTFKLRLTPNGFSSPKTQCVIGPGVAVNLTTLKDEIQSIESHSIDLTTRLWVSPRCHVVMPYHPMLDGIYEEAKGGGRTGTTRRGMGPVYADKVSYNGIRLADLADEPTFSEKLRIQLSLKNRIFRAFDVQPLDFDAVKDQMLSAYEQVKQTAREPFGLVQETLKRGGSILLEGAQGALLDNDWGTYPFCTASTTLAGGASAGLGLPPHAIQRVIGVVKAYQTRVGAGPMPTELLDDDGEKIRKAGNEYGTVTGRPRRCGWFDAGLARFTAELNGLTEIALTKLDVLDGLPKIKLCVGYRHRGDQALHAYWEGDARWLAEVEPVYEEMDGWLASTQSVTEYTRLPAAAQAYIRRIEELAGVRVSYVTTGPAREEIIRL